MCFSRAGLLYLLSPMSGPHHNHPVVYPGFVEFCNCSCSQAPETKVSFTTRQVVVVLHQRVEVVSPEMPSGTVPAI